jgi:DNA-binding transcriptional MerR regulator
MEKVWMKIGEAAGRVGVKPKELRYWETLIPEIQPRRSRGNLRYYHVDELGRLEQIRDWLKAGFTVADCRQLLLTGQVARGLDLDLDPPVAPAPARRPRRTVPRKAVPVPGLAKVAAAPGLATVAAALRELADQLGRPVKP